MLGLCLAVPAHAVLGEAEASVHADQMRLHGARHLSQTLLYQVHDITQADGSVLRQFVTPSGQVFAVVWRSHLKPNLQSLLGSHFANYAQATRDAAPRQGYTRQNAIQSGNLVVTESVQMGLFTGRASLRHLVPEGVDANALR
jgi:hypothetical protein